jgi:Holliday junction resolvase
LGSRSARIGSKFELDLVAYLRANGVRVNRLRQTGKEDEGDLHVIFPEHDEIIEAKAEQRIDLPGYLRELAIEKANFAKHRGLPALAVGGVVVVKRRNGSLGQAYVVKTLDQHYGIGEQ